MKNPNLGHPVKNRHNVPVKQWKKWSNHAKKVFNGVMQDMRPSMQWAFLHPDCPIMKKAHWATVRWNAAWIAACVANGDGKLAGIFQNGKLVPASEGTRRGK